MKVKTDSQLKYCPRCEQIKPLLEFGKSKNRRGGVAWLCRECSKEYNKQHRANNPAGYRKSGKKYASAHKKKINEYKKQWVENNQDKIRMQNRRSDAKRLSTLTGRLNNVISSRIATSLHGAKCGRSWETLVGYTLEQLKKHLASDFDGKMTWDNYGVYWHIDHIVPISAFNSIAKP